MVDEGFPFLGSLSSFTPGSPREPPQVKSFKKATFKG
jgi:hypothetical protein